MKRLGVAGVIISAYRPDEVLLGRRGKDPNRGLYVFPGGGVQDGESLEDALCREIMEETGLQIERVPNRWDYADIIELPDRLILVKIAWTKYQLNKDDVPKSGSDLYDVEWFPRKQLPHDISPILIPMLPRFGLSRQENL